MSAVSLPEIPADLAGWQWRRTTDGGALLEAPDGSWQTNAYSKSVNKAIGEARRRKVEQGKQLDQVPVHLDPRLPKLPLDLAGWRWESEGGAVRLINPTEGWATDYQAFLLANDAIVEAIAITARDAALVAEMTPATAVTSTPGPDAQGVYRRPLDMPERSQIAPGKLLDGRWQPRTTMDEQKLVELADSIVEHGILEDLIAIVNEQGELELVTGHRRKAAALRVSLPAVPVKVLELTLGQATALAIISNDQREDISEVDRGKAYERMIRELGLSEVELAKQIGRPRTYIQQRRQVASACEELQRALSAGDVSFTQARLSCEGSGGSHDAQRAALQEIQQEQKRGRTLSGEEAKRTAERFIRSQHEAALKDLGWKHAEWWAKEGTTYHFYFAPTAKPERWSSGEILAVVREERQPPLEGGPAPLVGEDRTALEFRGWEVSDRCKPWAMIRRGKELIVGDATDLAPQIAAAKKDLAALQARFERKQWGVSWKGQTMKLLPHAEDAKGKAKKLAAIETRSYDEAIRIINKVDRGEWTPEAKVSQGYDYRQQCARCGTKTTEYSYLEGRDTGSHYYCKPCGAIVQAEVAELKAKFAVVIDGHLGLWLDSAPELGATLLLLQSRSDQEGERGAQLRAVFVDWLWRYRSRFTFVEQPTETPAPATAVAAPPTAPHSGAETPAAARRSIAEILDELSVIEERWAGGGMDSADGDTLEALAEDLEAQIGELDAEVYDSTAAQIAGLLRRLLEQGVPS